MKRILIAGATGYLGKYLVQSFKRKGYYVKVLVRNPQKLEYQGPFLEPAVANLIDEVHIGDVTDATTLKGCCKGIDSVCSAIGLTRQKDNMTFYNVDYLGNLALLKEAEEQGVQKFMYIHASQGEEMSNPVVEAKQLFVNQLIQSPLNYIIVKPTGYFSDLSEYIKMAHQGRVYLIGSGKKKVNPIHGEDLAEYCTDVLIHHNNKQIDVGGPHVYKHEEIAKLAFQVLQKKEKITRIPAVLIRVVLPVIKVVNKKQYGLLAFFYEAITTDVVAPSYGKHKLRSFFKQYIERSKGDK
ncbi:SDR family oxidoreductase [Pontibacillus yanchengensis]|uniref:NAD-dependent dehydratase n=1 Tax=Pontibacillus yanchengensis Y32 TaxID=1385514 RepID=A0A0A2T9Y8_9BACI|nr:SDR family oxidoreductase [Pontibacillus yanchengensis]KGP72334.1 NAD-dependent dehydratase [Pontibacillus yanchengensis Y32]